MHYVILMVSVRSCNCFDIETEAGDDEPTQAYSDGEDHVSETVSSTSNKFTIHLNFFISNCLVKLNYKSLLVN